MRNSASLKCARVTGSTGISGGCGNRSSRYSMITRESYRTRSRSTSVGTLLYGFRSRRSSGRLPSSTSTMSMLMLFSASTSRVRWLHGHAGFENSVMTDRRLAITVIRNTLLESLLARYARRGSMDVPPDFPFQHPREQQEHEQEAYHANTERAPLELHRLADVAQKVHDITRDLIELRFRQEPRHDGFEARDRRRAVLAFGLLEYRSADALKLPQHVRHRGIRQDDVVGAGRFRRVEVEAAQEIVNVILPARPRNQRQIGRRDAEPPLRVVTAHRVRHRLERLLIGEDQVLDELILGQLQALGELVVTHVLCRMAAEAVVHEILRAPLQRRGVVDVRVRRLERDSLARPERDRSGQCGYGRRGCRDACDFAPHFVTLAGTGLVFSFRV